MRPTPSRPRAARLIANSKPNAAYQRIRRFVCEPVERRLLLSAAFFATPTSLTVPGARAPVVADYFHTPGNSPDLAVATPTSVQLLTASPTGGFSLGASIPLPANPAAETPFLAGQFTVSGGQDIVLASLDSTTGNGLITYETNSGSATFTTGPVSTITDDGKGFTPLSGGAAVFTHNGLSDLAIIGKPKTGSQLVLAILVSNSDGTFTEAEDYPIAGSDAAGNISNEEVFTDIDNEIVVYDGSGKNLDVFSGPGDGTFTQLTPMPEIANLAILATYNSLQDMVLANGNKVSLLVNQGDGTFKPNPQAPITLPGPVTAMAYGDFNVDQNNDIITNQGILFGNGNGTFSTTPQPLPVAINGGNNFSGTMLGATNHFFASDTLGIVGFSASGNPVISAANQFPGVSFNLQSSKNPANPGDDITFTATVSSINSQFPATPTGTVTFSSSSYFRIGGNGGTEQGGPNPPFSFGTLPLVNGTATIDFGPGVGGTYGITAKYSGDTTFGASETAGLTQIVLAPATTTVASSMNPALAGNDVVFTAMVSGDSTVISDPGGNVEFFDNGVDLGGGLLDGNGVATFNAAASLAVGAHAITAEYQGDSNYLPGTSTVLTQTVEQLAATTITVVSGKNPSLAGDDVRFTAMVSGNDGAGDVPSGNVEFLYDGIFFGNGMLDATGAATFDGGFSVGSHAITAQYQGDANFSPGQSAALTQTVEQSGLVPVVVRTTLPGSIVSGTSAHGVVTVSIKDQLSSKLTANSITIFASNGQPIAMATPIASEILKHGIRFDAGQTKDVKLRVKSFPPALAIGGYTLVAEVMSSLDQINDSSSTSGPSVNIAAPFVQLAGVSGTGTVKPNPVKAGKSIRLTIRLTNSGNIAPGVSSLNIGLSTDGQTESTMLQNLFARIIKIKPGRSGVLHLHVTIPATVAAGNYQPFVSIVDDGDSTTVIGQEFAVKD